MKWLIAVGAVLCAGAAVAQENPAPAPVRELLPFSAAPDGLPDTSGWREFTNQATGTLVSPDRAASEGFPPAVLFIREGLCLQTAQECGFTFRYLMRIDFTRQTGATLQWTFRSGDKRVEGLAYSKAGGKPDEFTFAFWFRDGDAWKARSKDTPEFAADYALTEWLVGYVGYLEQHLRKPPQ